jgi:MFS family permease
MVNKVKNLRFHGVLAPLNNFDFCLLISSNFLWWTTRFMEMTVVGWLVLDLTNSPWQVSVIGFYRSAPFLVAGFWAGSIIDSLGRRRVIVYAQAVSTLSSGLIMTLLWLDRLAFWQLAVSVAVIGFSWSLDWPARRTYMPDLVGKAQTVEALLLENLMQNIARIVGPFLGGSLIAAIRVEGAYTVLAALALLTLLLLLGLSKRPLPHTHKVRSSPRQDMIEGWRYVRHNQPILGVLSITMIMNLWVFPYMLLLPVFARDVLGQGPVGLGILGAGAGLGAFIGLVIINHLRHAISPGWILGLGSLSQAVTILLFSVSSNFTLSLILLVLSGLGQACFGTMQSSIMLLAASDEMRSRAMGTLVLAIGSAPIGQLEVGALAELLGAPLAVGGHAGVAVLSILGTIGALPRFRQKLETEERRRPVIVDG